MLRVFKYLAVPFIVTLTIAPAMAKPTVIAELGSAPLYGTSVSTAQMRERVARNEGRLAAAARELGLTSDQYEEFHSALDDSRVAWTTVPRHLDAMTWRSGETVYALHDVVIPAHVHGWEVDLHRGNKTLALYMPATCGNLSIVRTSFVPKPKPVALVAPARVVPVAAAPAAPPPPPPPNDSETTVAAAEPEYPPVAAVPVSHGFSFLPLLAGLAALGGGGSSGSSPAVGSCP